MVNQSAHLLLCWQLQALPSSAPLGWVKVDAKPIKQALITWASKWIYLYTHYLQTKVTAPGCMQGQCTTLFLAGRLCAALFHLTTSTPLGWHVYDPGACVRPWGHMICPLHAG